MTEIEPFATETTQEKRLHKVEEQDRRFIPTIEYVNSDYQVPRELVKYYRSDKFGYKVLKDSKIWASNPFIHFNDPFDCAIQMWELDNFPVDFVISFLRNAGYDITTDCPPIVRKMFFEKVLQILGIFCLNDNSNSELFWGYYNNHEGFTLKFNTSKLSEYWDIIPLKVEYVVRNKFQKLSLNEEEIRNNAFVPKLVRWTSVKEKKWEHENEWRFLFLDIVDLKEKEMRLRSYSTDAILEVVLGYKFFPNLNYERINRYTTKYTFDGDIETNYSFKILEHLYFHRNYS